MNKALLILIVFFGFASAGIAQWNSSAGTSGNIYSSCTSSGGKLFSGTANGTLGVGTIYQSTDDGQNWSVVNTGLTFTAVMSMASRGAEVFAGTYQDGYLYSANSGANWVKLPVNGDPQAGVFKIGLAGSNIFLYTNTNNVFYLSTNNGTNWIPYLTANLGQVTSFSVINSTFYATSYQSGLHYSTNNGANWVHPSNTGLPQTFNNYKPLYSVVQSNNVLYAASLDGFASSTDNGNTWLNTNMNLSASANIYTLLISGTTIIAGIHTSGPPVYGVMTTTNLGVNWTTMAGGLPSASSFNQIIISNTKLAALDGYNHIIWYAPVNQLTPVSEAGEIASVFSLEQNYPNPFNPGTVISYSLQTEADVQLTVYNAEGKQVRELVNGRQSAGIHRINFDGSALSSGIYFYKLTSGRDNVVKRMILLK